MPWHGCLRNVLICRSTAVVPAQNFLSQLLNKPFNAHVVSDGDEIDLGGRTLRFVLAPYLHWPDTMFTYLVEDAVLFPCDAFGAHYCASKLFDDEIPDFSADFHFYFDCIMRPFKDKVRAAVAKVDALELKMICPSHGPIRRIDPRAVVDSYRRWSALPPAADQSTGPDADHVRTRQYAQHGGSHARGTGKQELQRG